MVGVDARSYFTIDQQGQFSFKEDSPPNFERPQGSGLDSNEYVVTIEVRDDISNVDSLPGHGDCEGCQRAAGLVRSAGSVVRREPVD